jgi:hypothetical protein
VGRQGILLQEIVEEPLNRKSQQAEPDQQKNSQNPED